jgi:hypothetical protein
MKKHFYLAIFMTFSLWGLTQRSCHTMENHERLLQENPMHQQILENIEQFTQQAINNGTVDMEKVVITIPVVVHVLYNSTSQNISDAQIQSQLTVLNNDFRKLNSDWTSTPSTFTSLVADCEINFCLATVSPTGAATNGIIRKSTTVTSFSANDAMKFTAQGGSDAWPTGQYLNIWVCNLGGGLLGYAQFPGGSATTDGVVINYTAFGTTGTATAPFNKGRTGTHEVGHWLNLRHIWGDASCGSDLVSDTPVHSTSNYGCPSHPKSNTCGTSAEMFMNYMDYTDDACMYMFSAGQKARMQALFVTGGARESLKTSNGCSGTSIPQYCTANGTNTTYEWISKVQYGAINNTSGSNGGYGNFTGTSTNITKGTANTITLTPGFASTAYAEYFNVYVDLNADLDFADAGELLYTSPATTAAVSASITIPTTAITGSTRMRVMMKDAAITGPCEVFTYGEVEDYTLNLQASATTCSAPSGLLASSVGTATANLSWTAVTGASNYSLQYKKSTTTTWTTVTVTGTSYALTGLSSATTYNWQVRTNCTSGSSAYTVGTNFTTLTTCTDSYESNNTLSAAKSITVNTNINAIISSTTDIDWFKFSNTSTAKNIRVTLSNLPADYDLRLYNSAGTLLFSSENGSTTSEVITYNNAPVATYYVRVIGYNGAFNASACYRINASRSSTAFKENPYAEEDIAHDENASTSVLNVFPNPSSDGRFTCHLSNEVLGTLTMDVFDASGRLLETKTLDKTSGFIKTDIQLQQHGQGVYLLKVHNSEFQQTVRMMYTE